MVVSQLIDSSLTGSWEQRESVAVYNPNFQVKNHRDIRIQSGTYSLKMNVGQVTVVVKKLVIAYIACLMKLGRGYYSISIQCGTKPTLKNPSWSTIFIPLLCHFSDPGCDLYMTCTSPVTHLLPQFLNSQQVAVPILSSPGHPAPKTLLLQTRQPERCIQNKDTHIVICRK